MARFCTARMSSADENQVSAHSLAAVNDSVSESAVQKHQWAEQDPLLLVSVVRSHYIDIYINGECLCVNSSSHVGLDT